MEPQTITPQSPPPQDNNQPSDSQPAQTLTPLQPEALPYTPTPPVQLPKKKRSKIPVVIMLVLLAAVAGTAAWYFLIREDAAPVQNQQTDQTSEQTPAETTTEQNGLQTMELNTAPLMSLQFGNGWERETEYGYPRDGLLKTIEGRNYKISFSRNNLDYDYMNRKAGGAYPPGSLYKQVTANGKPHYIGITDGTSSVGGIGFVSTCAPSADAGCSIFLPEGYGYMIIDLKRLDSSAEAGSVPLSVANAQDKQILDEFADIVTTLKY